VIEKKLHTVKGEDKEQNHQWIFKTIDNNQSTKYPFVVIDNWFTPQEEIAVWKELDYISSIDAGQLDRAENTIVARDSNGNPKGKSYRWYYSNFFTDFSLKYSTIYNTHHKIYQKNFKEQIEKCTPYSRSFFTTNRSNILISYYEDNDYYDSHFDTFLWTSCIWMVKEPRKFSGGDFIFDESNTEIKLKNNRAVFFPCCYLHTSTPIKFNSPTHNFGDGKYTITSFYYTIPKSEPKDD